MTEPKQKVTAAQRVLIRTTSVKLVMQLCVKFKVDCVF